MNTNSEKLLLKDEVFRSSDVPSRFSTLSGMVLLRNHTRMRWVGVILNFKHRKLEWERIAL
jgi:hypothetical protein